MILTFPEKQQMTSLLNWTLTLGICLVLEEEPEEHEEVVGVSEELTTHGQGQE